MGVPRDPDPEDPRFSDSSKHRMQEMFMKGKLLRGAVTTLTPPTGT
jgi:hypothetical protein